MEDVNSYLPIISLLLGSTVLTSLVGLATTVITFKLNRKATKEDRKEEKETNLTELRQSLTELSKDSEESDKSIEEKVQILQEDVEKLLDAVSDVKVGQKIILHSKILHLARQYITQGWVTHEDKSNLIKLHKIYHNNLGGNGDFDQMMKTVNELEVRY